jgi:hypothetical protein
VAGPEQPCRADWGEPSAAEQAIADELQKPTEIEFLETPFQDVFHYLEDYHEIQIEIDQRALGEVGIPSDTPITKHLKGISLRSALRLLLRDLDLTYVIRDEVLLITTPERAETTYLCTRVYPVAELVESGRAGGSESRGCDYLIEAIMTCISPQSWGDLGGPGVIVAVPPGRPKALAVTQDPRIHDEIADFLEAVCEAVRVQASGQLQPVGGSPLTAAAEKRIAKALSQPTEFEFIETPLQDIVDTLDDVYKIRIEIDQRALDECGIPSDSLISKNLRGLSLASALKFMLRELDLTYVVRDEVVLITTGEEAETMLVTRIYPLNGLAVGRREPLRDGVKDRWKRWASSQESDDAAARGLGSPSQSAAPDHGLFTYPDLIKTITALIAPGSWSDVGGPGDLSVVSVGTLEALVVMQTREVHEEIAGLLGRPEFRRPAPSSRGMAPKRFTRRQRR